MTTLQEFELDNYETNDICMAAFLKVMGCKLLHIEKIGNYGTFHFENVKDSLLEQYNLGNARVEPAHFHQEVKFLSTSVKRRS